MLPILSLFGLALAAVFLPEPAHDTADAPDDDVQELSDQRAGTSHAAPSPEAQDLLALADAQESVQHGTDDADTLWGTDDADTIFGAWGEDTVYGGAGDDILFGDDDAVGDDLIGGDGNDIFQAGDQDSLTLGAGDDVIRIAAAATITVDDFNPDDDRIEVIYERGNPVPTLETVTTETGLLLRADDQLVAELRGVYALDLDDVKLIAA